MSVQLSRPATHTNDTELLVRMIAREPAAWRTFHAEYGRVVWRCIGKVATRFSTHLARHDLEEIHANFWAGLVANDMRKLRAYDPARGSRLSTFVGLLAINCAWDFLRTVQRRPATEPLAVVAECECESADPFETTAKREDCQRVEAVLGEFSRRDRDFVTLYFVDGRTVEEVAAEMNISVKTVYTKKHKIRTRLERLLTERGIELAA